MTTEVPINIVISSKSAEDGGQKVIKTLDEIKKKSQEAKNSAAGLSKSLEDTGKASSSANTAIKQSAQEVTKLNGAASLAKTAVTNLLVAFSAKAFLDAAVVMQNLEARITTMARSAEAGAQAMTYLTAKANEQGVELKSLADGFTRLIPSVKAGIISFKEMDALLTLTNDNIRAFGLQTQQVDALFLGLSQTFGSGQVTLEDLRQVTDQLPGTFNEIAKAMGKAGVTTDESAASLKKFISDGKLTADLLKGPLLDALRLNEGSAKTLGDTFTAQMARMENAFLSLAKSVGDTGLLDLLSAGVQRLTDAINVLTLGVTLLQYGFVSLGDNTDLSIKLAEQYNHKLDEMYGRSKIATDQLDKLAGESSGSTGLAKVSKEAKAAAKEQDNLNKKLSEMLSDQEQENFTITMSEGAKEVSNFQYELEKLSKSVGGFNAKQQSMADLLVTNKAYLVKQKEEIKALKEAQEQLVKDANDAAQEYAKAYEAAAEELAKPFENAAREIQASISGGIERGLKGEINTAKEVADEIKNIFFKLAAETATLTFLNASGLNSTIASITGTPSKANAASSLINQVGSTGVSVLGSTGIGASINAFGASALPSLFSAGIGPTALSAGLGGAPAAGGLLAGAGIGLSSIVLPIAGLAVGALLSSVIGGSRPHPASNFAATIGGSGDADLQLFSKHTDTSTGSALGKSVGEITKSLVAAGLNVGGQVVQGGVDDGRGFFTIGTHNFKNSIDDKSKTVRFDPKNQASADSALGELAVRLAMTAKESAQYADQLKRVSTEGRTAEQVLSDITFITGFQKSLEEAKPALGAVETAIKIINDAYDTTRQTMDRLGFTLKDVNALESKRTSDLEKLKTSVFSDSVKGFIESINPAINRLSNLTDIYKAKIKDFNASGIDTTFVTKQYQVEQEKLLNQLANDRVTSLQDEANAAGKLVDDYQKLSDSLAKTISNLRIGSLSPLSKEQKLAEARALFNTTASKAALGDTEAASQLDSLANQFLSLSKDYYASSDRFVQDFNAVEQALNKAKDVADRQVSIQQQIANSAKQQVDILKNGFATLTNASLYDQAKALNASTPIPGFTQDQLLSQFPETANSIYVKNKASIQSSGLESTFLGLLDSYTRGTVGGAGRQATFLRNNPTVNSDLIQVARQLGIPGFDAGGTMQAGQVSLVGERSPEILRTSKGGKIIPIQNGDNIEQRLKALEKESKATNNILQYGFNAMLEKADKQTQAITDNTRAVVRK
jgi:tape measure domain-containing protein